MTAIPARGQGEAPGTIDTGMGRNDEVLRRVEERTAMGRRRNCEDVVGALAFFASDEASFITGRTLPVCGGSIFG